MYSRGQTVVNVDGRHSPVDSRGQAVVNVDDRHPPVDNRGQAVVNVDGRHPPVDSRGQAVANVDDRADRLASNATTTSGLRLWRSEVMGSVRYYMRAQSQRHHTIDRLEEEK